MEDNIKELEPEIVVRNSQETRRKLEMIKYSWMCVTPVIADSIVVAVVVGRPNSLQFFGQQVSVKPGGD